MSFIPGIKPAKKDPEKAYWFLFKDENLLISNSKEKVSIPFGPFSKTLGIRKSDFLYFATLNGFPCYTALKSNENPVTEGYDFFRFIFLHEQFTPSEFAAINYAFHVIRWHHQSVYCGVCGGSTTFLPEERGKKCSLCNQLFYPRISPCIIVAVIKNDLSILLARFQRHGKEFNSVLAGYVELGETLEECVKREVFEETGIEVHNIKYFGSQPWALSQSLMIGFTAEYLDGEIQVDGKEIEFADWYHIDNLPSFPSRASISGALINWFAEQARGIKN